MRWKVLTSWKFIQFAIKIGLINSFLDETVLPKHNQLLFLCINYFINICMPFFSFIYYIIYFILYSCFPFHVFLPGSIIFSMLMNVNCIIITRLIMMWRFSLYKFLCSFFWVLKFFIHYISAPLMHNLDFLQLILLTNPFL